MLLATAAHFNQALTLWCEFGLCVMSYRLYCGTFLYKLMNKIMSENSCQIFVMVATHCLQFAIKKKSSRRRRGGWKKTLSLPRSAKEQCAIWDNTTLVEISELHNKCTALKCTVFKYTDQSMRFGTHNLIHASIIQWIKSQAFVHKTFIKVSTRTSMQSVQSAVWVSPV